MKRLKLKINIAHKEQAYSMNLNRILQKQMEEADSKVILKQNSKNNLF